MTRYEHKGGAVPTKTTAEVAADALTIPLAAADGWPDGTVGPFWACLNKGSLTEEKVLCSSRSGLTLQVLSDASGNGRGKDDTVAHTHPINSTVEHVWTAVEADESNAHLNIADGAHGYPPKATLVTTDGDQIILGKKVLTAPDIEGGEIHGATSIDGTKISVTGAQAEAEFRVRNVYIGSGLPGPALGNDGDIYINKG